MTFLLTSEPLENMLLNDGIQTSEAGAFVNFTGLVRQSNPAHSNKKVTHLLFEADESLCAKEIHLIFNEAVRQFDCTRLKCAHRTGKISVGEMIIWIGAAAPHRHQAFNACQYVLDQLKALLPIWKKEFYIDGTSQWVGNAPMTEESHEI